MDTTTPDIRNFNPDCPGYEIDLNAVRRFFSDKQSRRREKLDQRFRQATDDCRRIIDHITSHYPVRRIYQWGSLLDRRKFSEISDIDIALEGVASYRDFSAILGDAMKMTSFPLDIVEMERVGEENARYIREHGRLVHGGD